jgi:hypothetical protein
MATESVPEIEMATETGNGAEVEAKREVATETRNEVEA